MTSENGDNIITSSEYLKQLQSGVSAIELECFCQELLLSPDKTQGVHNIEQIVNKILLETGPGMMASHLFKRNVKFIGLDFDTNSQKKDNSNGCGVKSGIELMIFPSGKQMR